MKYACRANGISLYELQCSEHLSDAGVGTFHLDLIKFCFILPNDGLYLIFRTNNALNLEVLLVLSDIVHNLANHLLAPLIQ